MNYTWLVFITESRNQDPSSEKTIKTIALPDVLGGIPAVHGGHLFVKTYQSDEQDPSGVPNANNELRFDCVDLDTGKTVWTFTRYGEPVSSQPVFYDGLMLDVSINQLLHWMNEAEY
jgi:hypothetical protein